MSMICGRHRRWPARSRRRAARQSAPKMPAPRAYRQWATAILTAARATPHRFGDNKAFIAGVLDELVNKYVPDDRAAFEVTVLVMLATISKPTKTSNKPADAFCGISGNQPGWGSSNLSGYLDSVRVTDRRSGRSEAPNRDASYNPKTTKTSNEPTDTFQATSRNQPGCGLAAGGECGAALTRIFVKATVRRARHPSHR